MANFAASGTPPALAWLRDEAGLRAPAIARLVGLTPDAYVRWCAGAWVPSPHDAPLLPAIAAVHQRACTAVPDLRTRCGWWVVGQREYGWLSPAELLRRGKIGELLILLAPE